MTVRTILVIDDSATIRKMVDNTLSQEGYRVILAPNGEEGIERARELIPDLVLLDHQLPGTTGIEVCRKILQFPECARIPFVVSSTLRKKAYIEYMEVPNVVDSLPKPFMPDHLKMTVANALETSAMVLDSQSNGTAVPEVVGEQAQAALAGDFRWIGLRELIDFLNNAEKHGMLEVETQRNRICFFLKDGRVQAVVSASFDVADAARQLPESLRELGPLLRFTMGCGSSTQLDGLSELLDRKVIDPRMLRTLLRHQAAILTRYCFRTGLRNFSFYPERNPPSIFTKTAVDACLAAILVDGSLNCPESELPPDDLSTGWLRQGLRGQNLDRTGLSARHVQLLSCLDSAPRTVRFLAEKSGLARDEVRRVFDGFAMAEWTQKHVVANSSATAKTAIIFEPDAQGASIARTVFADAENPWTGHVVRDLFGLQLLLKRGKPDAILITAEGASELNLPEKIAQAGLLNGCERLGLIVTPEQSSLPLCSSLSGKVLLKRHYSRSDLLKTLELVSQSSPPAAAAGAAAAGAAAVTAALAAAESAQPSPAQNTVSKSSINSILESAGVALDVCRH